MKLFKGNWLRESEHVVLRIVSLVFSIGSAYAIRWFFEPLDVGDPIHYVLWWIVSAGFGLLGFYLSRSLAHRMMMKESIWLYTPVFLLAEFFEILCNYAKAVAAVAMGQVPWVVHAPVAQQSMMVVLTYVGWSILPLVSPAMAVADMDMTRRRNGEASPGQLRQGPQLVGQRPQLQRPQPGGLPQQAPQRQPLPRPQLQPQQAPVQGQPGGAASNPPPGVTRPQPQQAPQRPPQQQAPQQRPQPLREQVATSTWTN